MTMNMRYMKTAIPALAAVGLVGVFTTPSQSQAPAAGEVQIATVKQYCQGCHNDKAKTGGVSFEGMTDASVAKDPDLYERAVRKLRGRVMPPPGAKQPEGKAVDALVAYLETSLDKIPEPKIITDQVVLHRLNRKEYENAVRDLLTVEVKGAEML